MDRSIWLLFFVILGQLKCSLTTTEATFKKPSFIGCRSPEQVTFTCWWSVGSFTNLSESGDLKVQYRKGKEVDWFDCPEYIHEENGCHFNSSYSNVWTPYCVKLLSKEDVEYDQSCFSVDEIVTPDPPINLNWTLLNVSRSGIYADVLVSWEAPPSADVAKGWIALDYQLQYKDRNETQWQEEDPTRKVKLPVYSLITGREYEIRVRCKQRNFLNYGEFSNAIHVIIPRNIKENLDTAFPMIFVLTFGAIGLTMIILLLMLTKQQRLKLLILPPVPVPKIKGIDPDLLKNGKLDELNSVLAGSYGSKPILYMDDTWVEFIEVDIDDPDEKTHGSDMEKLLGEDIPNSHNCQGIKDDDSGRDSCYEPDVPDTDDAVDNPCHSTSDQPQEEKIKEDLLCLKENDNISPSCFTSDSANSGDLHPEKRMSSDLTTGFVVSEESKSNRPPVHSQLSNQSSVNLDFYTQVSDITPAGGVLLSPGQQSKAEKIESKPESREPSKYQIPAALIDAYTSEMDVKKMSNLSKESKPVLEKAFDQGSYFTAGSLTSVNLNSSVGGEYQHNPLMPVSDYTSIQMIDSQLSLIPKSDTLPSRCFSKPPYVTPDQLSSFMP
ncbi:growth hormone receptor [Protopterus annectens]|uniref:growth hormone receptor n=1 Tax=Protopterus annectens TaxID=7888 RepID=UPI001CFBFBDC|nr:growth hormone receptor [Protopterus annectens]XP_043925679.1 growth hormone receptor [Protopterus annectens]XP_043925684.1 growth hormone receptor [Protopterus annectens]